jgi:hypothetical protein
MLPILLDRGTKRARRLKCLFERTRTNLALAYRRIVVARDYDAGMAGGMEFDEIARLRANTRAWRLLRADTRRLCSASSSTP